MKSGPSSNPTARIIVAFAMLAAMGQAFAQYVWTDEKGVRQYSDRPPPASVPDSRIIRGKSHPGAPAAVATTSEAPAAATAPPKAAPSLAERNADFNKRRTQQAETDRKAAEEQRLGEQKKSNCERAASYKRTLESGTRVGRVNANGERVILDDDQRQQELKEAAKALEGCAG